MKLTRNDEKKEPTCYVHNQQLFFKASTTGNECVKIYYEINNENNNVSNKANKWTEKGQ